MRLGIWWALALCVLWGAGLSGCAVPEPPSLGAPASPPRLTGAAFFSVDGAQLPLRQWRAEGGAPRAIIIGVHGMNDYGNAFALPGEWFAQHGVSVISYDQRGFGEGPGRGRWAGGDAMTADLQALIALVKRDNPSTPVYVLGLSMGAAVILSAAERERLKGVDGAILAAPAVWGWRAMNPFYKSALWVTAHAWPSKILTGARLEIWPSDNIEMLRAYARDPLVLKETRVDTVYGLVTLMDEGYLGAAALTVPTLLVYGAKDEIVPARPVREVAAHLGGEARFVVYDAGYHMLLRDLQRETVWRDILAWMDAPRAPLPSIAGRAPPAAREEPAGMASVTAAVSGAGVYP